MNTITFQGVNYTQSSIKDLSNSGLVDLYNDIVEEHSEFKLNLVNRFSSKEVAQNRVWAVLQRTAGEVQPVSEVQKMQAADAHLAVVCKVLEATPEPAKKVLPINSEPSKKVRERHINSISTKPLKPFRKDCKYDLMIQLLEKPEGTTLDELQKVVSARGKPWPMSWVVGAIYDNLKGHGYSVIGRMVGETFIVRLMNGN